MRATREPLDLKFKQFNGDLLRMGGGDYCGGDDPSLRRRRLERQWQVHGRWHWLTMWIEDRTIPSSRLSENSKLAS
ncbi:unnamed protein product [Cuscuta campestris]|uniref:Uncharacterized protein n=1 Tax=Cuscuta campestris TaxID=132261 RepID=A0A484KZR3_9ASTE|nr:unnamed protein product [Cuscuta campestris]